MATVLLCLCGDTKPDHVQGRKACKRCGTCDAFELDGEVSKAEQTRVLTAVAEVCEDQAKRARVELDGLTPKLAAGGPIRSGERVTLDPGEQLVNLAAIDLGESTSASLRRVEQERLRALEDLAASELALHRIEKEHGELAAAFDESDVARLKAEAELASARTELDAVRTARDRLDAELAEARRGQGDDTDRQRIRELAQELNSERARADRLASQPGLLYAYDAWSCLAEKGCGGRYTFHDPTHPCGRLTPTRVSITRRTEGDTTA